jgi:hypothetical protein
VAGGLVPTVTQPVVNVAGGALNLSGGSVSASAPSVSASGGGLNLGLPGLPSLSCITSLLSHC